MGLDLPLQLPVERLGQADRQLLVLARAFALQPRLLILDEPTAALSDPDAERLLELVDTQRSRGVAILYISPRMSDLQRVTNRAIALQDGRITREVNTRHLAPAAYTLFGDATQSALPQQNLSVPFLERFTRTGFIRNRAEGRVVREQVVGLEVKAPPLCIEQLAGKPDL